MKLVVTGATGFLGRPLCAELVRQGHSIVALTRDVAKARLRLAPEFECVRWGDNAPGAAWIDAIRAADTVVHLAGESIAEKAWTPRIQEELRRSRIETTRRLVDAMRGSSSRPSALICASGINYYGSRGDEVLTEKSPPGETFLARLCVDWEAEAAKAEELGVRVVRHRTGVVLEHGGPLDKILFPLPVKISPWKLGLGGPIGSGRQWFPWIHLSDAVGMFAWSAVTPAISGPVNTVAPELIRNVDFTRALGRALHRPALLPIPGFALRALVGGFADELMTSQRAEPTVAQQAGYHYVSPSIGGALESILGEGKR